MTPQSSMSEFSTQIDSKVAEVSAILCPSACVDNISVVVVAVFITLLDSLGMTVLIIVLHVVLVKDWVHTTHVTFGKLVYVYPVITTQQIFHFAIIFCAITTQVQSTVNFRIVTEDMRKLCVEIPVYLIGMAFFNHVDGTMTGSIGRVLFLALVDMIQVVPVDVADVISISHPCFIQLCSDVSVVIETR